MAVTLPAIAQALSRSDRLRERVRKAEVARLFAEQQEDSSEWPAAEHAAFMSPWREKDARGQLGPWYGPLTESAYERDMKAYQDTREAGALWDMEEAAKYGWRETARGRGVQRQDAVVVARYVHARDVRDDERRVYYCFWVDGLSIAKTARRLGMAHTAVGSMVSRLRARAKGGELAAGA